jgi:transcriptional regulator with GAF, ATPase, and Fis domain/tetratricopeptide (TPR) repeat protein
MKPLPLHDAAQLRPVFQEVQALLDAKKLSEAQARLEQLFAEAPDRAAPEYGEWCLMWARLSVLKADFRAAIERGREALTAFEGNAADDFLGDAHSALGLGYLGIGDSKNALIHLRDALAIYRRLGDEPGVIRAHNDLARVRFVRGEHDLAIEHLEDALEIARRRQEPEREAMLLGNMGRVCLLLGRWDDAELSLTQAHARAVAGQNWLSVGRNLLSLGYLSTLRHRFREALAHFDAALTAIEFAGHPRERAIYYEYSGWWQFEQKHWIAAKEAFRRSLELGRHLSTQNDIVTQSLRGLAECEAALQDWTEAARLAREGLAVAIPIGERAEVGALYRVLAQSLAHIGDESECRACLLKATECLDTVGDIYEQARLHAVSAEVLDRIEPDSSTAIRELDAAASIFSRLGAQEQLSEVRWQGVAMRRTRGMAADALALARELLSLQGETPNLSDQVGEVLTGLTRACVEQSISAANQFRLAGMPWSGASDEDLQTAIDFCRSRLSASRVLLIEIMASGQRSGRILASSGPIDDFAARLAALAANPYQRELPTDQPRYYWSTSLSPTLAAQLSGIGDPTPVSVISVPVELGPDASGLLYADILPGSERGNGGLFSPRDLEFAVAYAEVVAWRSTKLQSEGLLRDVRRLRDQLGRECEFPSIITHNPDFRETLSRVRLIVDSDVSIHLYGETGTGKDLLARAIHYSGQRRDRRFVSVNCAALPETLLESELFGVRRGAFTGADRDKAGLFEEADGGTFFLDEIGEMPVSIQAKLLRFLESKEFIRLGDTKPRHVDVRIISATNRDLTTEMEHGSFRRDLYYRLTPVSFVLPPLRERREDIPLLIEHFLEEICHSGGPARLAPEVVRALSAYDWPGNVRELENEIRKMVLLSEPGAVIGSEKLSRKITATSPEPEGATHAAMPDRFSLYDHIAALERRYIAQALNESGGIKKHAAARLGIPESTLRLKMRQYSLDSD